eukprot:5544580-Pyramimonas_sp.AAC.1
MGANAPIARKVIGASGFLSEPLARIRRSLFRRMAGRHSMVTPCAAHRSAFARGLANARTFP